MLVPPFQLQEWINANRDKLKPPVGNAVLWADRGFIVMAVGGPNVRTDYHINQGEEFFYQIEGTMNLRILEQGKPKDIPIRAGEVFLLPGKVPHSPQRPAGTVGLVIERKRNPGELDGFLWICGDCHQPMYREDLHVTDIVTQLPPIFERYHANPAHKVCSKCGWKAPS